MLVLSKHRTREVYNHIFTKLQEYFQNKNLFFQPKTILCDFEQALLNSLNNCFQNTRIQGCYFHFCQSIYRKIQSLGLSSAYMKNENFRIFLRFVMALAFLPNNEVKESYLVLEKYFLKMDPALDKFFEYFQRNWIKNTQLWNVHGETLRTNNDIEGWHFSISRNLGKKPDIYKFISFLQDEELMSRHLISMANSGRKIKNANKKYDRIGKKNNRTNRGV